jgi:hypothetical protein
VCLMLVLGLCYGYGCYVGVRVINSYICYGICILCKYFLLSTYLIYVCFYYCRDGKNMCLCSSCG